MNIEQVKDLINKRASATIASIIYKSKKTGEKARYSINLNLDLRKVYEKDLTDLKNINYSGDKVKEKALEEMINSLENSLKNGIGQNDKYNLKDLYRPIDSKSNLKIHRENGSYLIRGSIINKVVLRKGAYKRANPNPKTLAKKEIRKNLRSGKIRTFSLDGDALRSLRVNGELITA